MKQRANSHSWQFSVTFIFSKQSHFILSCTRKRMLKAIILMWQTYALELNASHLRGFRFNTTERESIGSPFQWRADKTWKSLPTYLFPFYYDPRSFKRYVKTFHYGSTLWVAMTHCLVATSTYIATRKHNTAPSADVR